MKISFGKILRAIIVALLLLLVAIIIAWVIIVKKVENQNRANTIALRLTLVEGVNDIEAAYSENLKCEVEVATIKAESKPFKEYNVIYPKELEGKYPVIIWSNGSGGAYKNYDAALKSLASYGFVVIANDDGATGNGLTTYELGLFAEEINSDLSYPFAGHMDVEHMGVGGHSQGGCGAINAATRYERSTEIFKSLFTTSMPHIGICNDMFPDWKYDVGLIQIPYYMNCGTGTFDTGVIPIDSMYNNYNGLPEGTPAVMAVMTGSDHNIVNDDHGCGSMNAWFCYTLKDDPIAAGLFTDKCELANNTERWQDVNTKNLKEL